MPGLTLAQLSVLYHSQQDAMPGAWLAPMQLPSLRGFWANVFDATTWYDLSALPVANHLTLTGLNPLTDAGQATTWPAALVPYIALDGANDYAVINDNAYLSVVGALTLGGWVYRTAAGAARGIMSKWNDTAGNYRSYALYTDAADALTLSISVNGGAATTKVVAGGVPTLNAWSFVVGRFDPSASQDVMTGGAWTRDTSTVPASIFDNVRQFQVGQYNEAAATRWSGYIAQLWLCAAAVPDAAIRELYNAQAPLFGVATI